MNPLTIGIFACGLGILLVSANLRGDDRSYYGGWISIFFGVLFLIRWFLNL